MDKAVITKIKKLLALGKSPNIHEAAAALGKAQELMTQHGLTAAAIEFSEITISKKKVASAAKALPPHIAILANLIARAFGVKAVFGQDFKWANYRLQSERFVHFVGPGSRPEVASYAYAVLARQLARDRAAFLKAHKRMKKRGARIERADAFCVGWVRGVSKVVTDYTVSETERSLIDSALALHYTLAPAKTKTVSLGGRCADDFFKGLASGSKARLHPGMNGQTPTEIRRLGTAE